MPAKLLFIMWAACCLAPVIMASLLADLSKQAATRLLIVFAALLFAYPLAGTHVGISVTSWLLVKSHWLSTISLIAIAFSVPVTNRILHRRSKLRRLQWIKQPPQAEFAEHCIRYLERHGWKRQTLLKGGSLTVCRMEKASRRITGIFDVSGISTPQRIWAQLKREQWKPYGRAVLITWRPPTRSLLEAASSIGWRSVSTRSLGQMEAVYDQPVHSPVEPPHEQELNAWHSLGQPPSDGCSPSLPP